MRLRLNASATYAFTIISLCCLLTSFSSLFPKVVHADDAGNNKPTVENHSEGNALRVSIENAIINYVNNARQTSIKIEWHLLPETMELQEMAAGVNWIPLTIRNSDLGNTATWASKITDKKAQEALARVLGLGPNQKLTEFNPLAAEDEYETNIQKPEFLLTSDEQITGLIDHYFLRFILSSSGIGYTVRSTDATIQGGERRLDREIVWKIKLYPVRTIKDFTFYRVSLNSELSRDETFLFPGTTQTKATLNISAAFKPSPNTIGVQQKFSFQSQSINIPQVQPTPLPTNTTKLGGTTVEGILHFIGNVDLSEVVAHNLFGGTNQASIYYGGLVGQGKVQQLVGVNQMIGHPAGDLGLGLLMGIAPSSNNALFLGPSLRTGTLTASFGGIALQKSTGTRSDTKVGIYPAATLALDLSKLVGGKKDTQTIKLDNSVIGGLKSPDDLAKQVYLINLPIDLSALNMADQATVTQFGSFIELKRTDSFGENGARIPITEPLRQTRVRVPLSTTPAVIHLIDRGYYSIQSVRLPEHFALRISDQPVTPPKDLGPIGAPGNSGPLTFRISVVRVP